MPDDRRPVCPLPHLGFCVQERCNFWDEARQECSGACFGDYVPLEAPWLAETPCVIYWTEDND